MDKTKKSPKGKKPVTVKDLPAKSATAVKGGAFDSYIKSNKI